MRSVLLRFFSFAFVLVVATGMPAASQTPSGGAPPLPPGMTPAMMELVMTPGKMNPPGLPKGLMPLGGCIPAMGYHYLKGKDPFGPIYGYYKGKPVFTEYMPTVKQFESGFNLDNIKALPGYTIDHVDVWFEKNGHPGLMVPHYDIHAYYVPHSAHMTYCGNRSGKR